MEISEIDYNTFNDWYKKNLPSFNCEICRSNSSEKPLLMPSTIFNIPAFDNKSAYPVILLCCNCCGNSRLMSAVHLEKMGCPIFNFLPKKKNVLRFFDYFKRGKK